MKRREHMRLERIHQESMTGYRRSLEDTTKKVTGKQSGRSGGKTVDVNTARVETEQRVGDPQFLAAALKAHEARRKLHGLDDVPLPEMADKINADMDLSKLSETELQTLAALIDKATDKTEH